MLNRGLLQVLDEDENSIKSFNGSLSYRDQQKKKRGFYTYINQSRQGIAWGRIFVGLAIL